MNYTERMFTCKREQLNIIGKEYLPEQKNREQGYQAIIVSHGFTGNYTGEAPYCEAFARMGYATYAFSFCGGTGTKDDASLKSDGETTEATILTEVSDLIAVKDYVKSLPYIDGSNLILVGFSQGGFLSGLAAARCKEEIKKLIMVYPALCIPDHARKGCLGGASYDPKQVPEVIDCHSILLGKCFHDTVVDMDPFLEISAYEGPVLVIHGLEDAVVDYAYAVKAKSTYRSGQCRLQLVRNAGHGFDEGQRESAVDSIRQFLQEREEILAVRVIITNIEKEQQENRTIQRIYFTGYCESPYFQGTVLPGGCDTQQYVQGQPPKIRAEYTLEGLDGQGDACQLHIVNQRDGKEWKPRITTDSKALDWMNHTDFTAVLEYGAGGPTVRIFAPKQ